MYYAICIPSCDAHSRALLTSFYLSFSRILRILLYARCFAFNPLRLLYAFSSCVRVVNMQHVGSTCIHLMSMCGICVHVYRVLFGFYVSHFYVCVFIDNYLILVYISFHMYAKYSFACVVQPSFFPVMSYVRFVILDLHESIS